jgi:phosphonoacetate hydrolase
VAGPDAARVVLPIADPCVRHHGLLGSCATAYLAAPKAQALTARIATLPGIDLAVAQTEARQRFDLPADRIGDIVVFADADTVIGTRPGAHDLSALDAPLRSHGGRGEQAVPMFANRQVAAGARPRHNYDASSVALSGSA